MCDRERFPRILEIVPPREAQEETVAGHSALVAGRILSIQGQDQNGQWREERMVIPVHVGSRLRAAHGHC